jgi:glucokinase
MGLYAGIDLGGTQLKYGLINEEEQVVFHHSTKTPNSIPELMELIQQLIQNLRNQNSQPLVSVGFGFPGIYAHREQRILQSPNYPSIENFDLVPALSAFIDIPFFIDNDANMAAYGEYKMGAAKDAHSLVLLTIGSGVGTGIIIEGRLWQGACGFAGELGHATVNPDGEKCNCGSLGCLETEVSGPKIVKNFQGLTRSRQTLTSKEIFLKAQAGDKAALEAFSQAGRFLGIGIAIAINVLNPEKVILGGGVMKAGDILLHSALQEARKRSYKYAFECCTIQRARLGNRAGFMGAACWAKDKLIPQV